MEVCHSASRYVPLFMRSCIATSSSPTSRSLFVHLRSNRRLFTKRLTTIQLAKSRWIFILALMKSGAGRYNVIFPCGL